MIEDRPLILTRREHDTIIAALRFWQRHALSGRAICDDEMEFADNGRSGGDAALSADEIDDLIEGRVNC